MMARRRAMVGVVFKFGIKLVANDLSFVFLQLYQQLTLSYGFRQGWRKDVLVDVVSPLLSDCSCVLK